MTNKKIKTYVAEINLGDKEIIALPISYARSSLENRKMTVEDPVACDIEDAKTKLLVEVNSGSTFKVIISAKNQKEALNSALSSPLREIDGDAISNLRVLGLQGKFGAISESSKLAPSSIETLTKFAQLHLPTINYGDYIVDNGNGKTKPKVTKIQAISKKPSRKSGVEYDISQSGSILSECVSYFSYNGAQRLDNGSINLKDLKMVSEDNIVKENNSGNRVIEVHYSKNSELKSRLKSDKLSDADKPGAALKYELSNLYSLHTKQNSNPNLLSRNNLSSIKELLINSQPQKIISSTISRDSFVAKKSASMTKELVNEV